MVEREQLLQQGLTELQQNYTQNMVDQETTNVADIVYLKIQAKKIVEDMETIDSFSERDSRTRKSLAKLRLGI